MFIPNEELQGRLPSGYRGFGIVRSWLLVEKNNGYWITIKRVGFVAGQAFRELCCDSRGGGIFYFLFTIYYWELRCGERKVAVPATAKPVVWNKIWRAKGKVFNLLFTPSTALPRPQHSSAGRTGILYLVEEIKIGGVVTPPYPTACVFD